MGRGAVVGVNKFKRGSAIDVLKVANATVRAAQIDKLRQGGASRPRWRQPGGGSGSRQSPPLAVAAAQSKATVAISRALESTAATAPGVRSIRRLQAGGGWHERPLQGSSLVGQFQEEDGGGGRGRQDGPGWP
jgi:hypothetical protein